MSEQNGSEAARTHLGHVPALDGLRAVSAALVVGFHLSTLVLVDGGFRDLLRGGFLGVDIFFVLSGFLITALLLAESEENGAISLRSFWWRRALRLLPVLYVFLAAVLLRAALAGHDRRLAVRSVASAAFYVLNYQPDSIVQTNLLPEVGPLWSLSVEEHFYFVWPIAVAALAAVRIRPIAFMALVAALVVLVSARRYHLYVQADGANWFLLYIRTGTRADGLLVGALAALVWRHWRIPSGALAVLATAAAAFAAWWAWTVGIGAPVLNKGGYTVYAVASAAIVLALVDGRWPGTRLLEWWPLQAVGRASYSLYLWHMLAITMVVSVGSGWPMPVRLAAAVGLIATFTVASWFCVEVPVRRWRERRGAMSVDSVRGQRPAEEDPETPAPSAT